MHCVELEAEVLDAAERYFGLERSDSLTLEVADAAGFLECHAMLCTHSEATDKKATDTSKASARAQAVGAPAASFDFLILDCFTAAGLHASIADGGALQPAAACLARIRKGEQRSGLCIVDLHTATGQGVLRDHDYTTSRTVLRALCTLFDAVYKLECLSSENVLALCHQVRENRDHYL